MKVMEKTIEEKQRFKEQLAIALMIVSGMILAGISLMMAVGI